MQRDISAHEAPPQPKEPRAACSMCGLVRLVRHEPSSSSSVVLRSLGYVVAHWCSTSLARLHEPDNETPLREAGVKVRLQTSALGGLG